MTESPEAYVTPGVEIPDAEVIGAEEDTTLDCAAWEDAAIRLELETAADVGFAVVVALPAGFKEDVIVAYPMRIAPSMSRDAALGFSNFDFR